MFEWLFGTEGPDQMRDSVRGTSLTLLFFLALAYWGPSTVPLVGISQNSEPLPNEAEPRGGANADVVSLSLRLMG